MNIKRVSILLGLLIQLGGCYRISITPVSFHNLSDDRPSLPAFYAFKNKDPQNSGSFNPYLFNEKGIWESAPRFVESPFRPLNRVGVSLFYPAETSANPNLDESPEIISADKRWAAKTFGVKTFNDDLDNDHLIIRDVDKGYVKKITVPALSNGEMWPLFWHPGRPIVFFMVTVGDTTGHSLELWEYDVANGIFQNIGDTNGDVYLSHDGKWIMWETGPFGDNCHLNPPLHCVLLCAYSIEKKVNYRLTEGPSISAFQCWKNN
jgi:hypothetical protein